MRIEAGQLDRAAVLAADLSRLGERHGFDVWRLVGATWQTAIGSLGALAADGVDQSALEGQISTMTTLLGYFDASGGEPVPYRLRRRPRAAADRRRPA